MPLTYSALAIFRLPVDVTFKEYTWIILQKKLPRLGAIIVKKVCSEDVVKSRTFPEMHMMMTMMIT